MRLPNGERAIVDIVKLREYCLSATHLRGRHKARVFSSRLGLTSADANVLRAALLDAAARRTDAVEGSADRFGVRYLLDFDLVGPTGTGTIRSAWIVRTGEDFPRFTTCYVI
jgi:hypothetical protein